MKLAGTFGSALAAATLMASPIAAQAAAPASRSGDDVQGENLRGGFIIPLIAIVAVILGIIVAVDNGRHHDLPTSP